MWEGGREKRRKLCKSHNDYLTNVSLFWASGINVSIMLNWGIAAMGCMAILSAAKLRRQFFTVQITRKLSNQTTGQESYWQKSIDDIIGSSTRMLRGARILLDGERSGRLGEEAIKKHERSLVNKTIARLNKESYYCGPAYGKLCEVVTAIAKDKGGNRIIKSVDNYITKEELRKLLYFNEFSDKENITIEIWFWGNKRNEPAIRKKLFYNQPNQRISLDLQNLVK